MTNNEKGLPTPITRKDKFQAKAAGMDVKIPKAITREEHYLKAIAENSGDVYGSLVAGVNISIEKTSDGKAKISATGEVSSEDTYARGEILDHRADKSNPHEVTKAQVGLGNVNNTSDSDKPISTATQVALNAKANAVDVYTKVETDALIDNIDVPTALADLTDDTTHRLVTDAEKTKLDGLANIKSVGVGLNLDNVTGELTATGGGTGGTTNYNDLSNKPQINSVTLSGNKSSADLGLADASDIPTALSDLTDDATHRTVADTEKAAWNGKQSALDSTQLSAVNSGINSTKVGQIATNASDISSLTTAVSAKIGAADYATQTTGGTVKVWTTTESGETTLHISTQ
jgi:hypothetical protein